MFQVYSSRTGNSLHQDMQEHWLAERAALQLSKKECAGDINPDIKSTCVHFFTNLYLLR